MGSSMVGAIIVLIAFISVSLLLYGINVLLRVRVLMEILDQEDHLFNSDIFPFGSSVSKGMGSNIHTGEVKASCEKSISWHKRIVD